MDTTKANYSIKWYKQHRSIAFNTASCARITTIPVLVYRSNRTRISIRIYVRNTLVYPTTQKKKKIKPKTKKARSAQNEHKSPGISSNLNNDNNNNWLITRRLLSPSLRLGANCTPCPDEPLMPLVSDVLLLCCILSKIFIPASLYSSGSSAIL